MKHPADAELALFSGGDLGFWRRWRVRVHLRGCPDCRSEVELYEQSRDALRGSDGDLPAWVNWDRLARDMSGNIRVGLAAGECVDGPFRQERKRHLGLLTVVAACLSLASFGIFWINLPADEAHQLLVAFHAIGTKAAGGTPAISPPDADGMVIDASPASIGMEQNGAVFSLLPQTTGRIDVSVSLQNSVGARYVDADTGQVTINRVYYEQ